MCKGQKVKKVKQTTNVVFIILSAEKKSKEWGLTHTHAQKRDMRRSNKQAKRQNESRWLFNRHQRQPLQYFLVIPDGRGNSIMYIWKLQYLLVDKTLHFPSLHEINGSEWKHNRSIWIENALSNHQVLNTIFYL